MRNKSRVDSVVVQKIIGYCDKVEELKKMFGNTFEDFEKNFAFQLAYGMCIIQIGELTTRLSEDFKEKNSAVEWKKIIALRNIHAHDYESVKFEVLWEILTEDIPDLKEKLLKILSETE